MSGCTPNIKPEKTVKGVVGHAEGQWRGRALVKNLKTSKSNTLSVDVIAREPSKLRLEITGPFGVHVASIAQNDNEVRCSLTQQKRFISGPANAASLARVIPVRLPPSTLMAILFERPLPNDWVCEFGAPQLPSECKHPREKVAIKWLERNGLSRRLKIFAPQAELELVLDEAKSKVQLNDQTFLLEPTEGYRLEQH